MEKCLFKHFQLEKVQDYDCQKCKKKTKGENVRISYIFHPTGIGNTVKVRSETLKIEKDVTDYKNW